MARFISQFLQSDREFLDQLLEADSARRQRRHEEGIPFVEIQPNEEVRYNVSRNTYKPTYKPNPKPSYKLINSYI